MMVGSGRPILEEVAGELVSGNESLPSLRSRQPSRIEVDGRPWPDGGHIDGCSCRPVDDAKAADTQASPPPEVALQFLARVGLGEQAIERGTDAAFLFGMERTNRLLDFGRQADEPRAHVSEMCRTDDRGRQRRTDGRGPS